MDILGPWHLLIVAAVFVLMFGAKRLPDAARSLGKSARILKTELNAAHHDHDADAAPEVDRSSVALVAPHTEPMAPNRS